jgi:hypothetical protein
MKAERARPGPKRSTANPHIPRPNGRTLQQSRVQQKLAEHGLRMGGLSHYLTEHQLDWIARDIPDGWTVAEYLATAILPDVMSEDEGWP